MPSNGLLPNKHHCHYRTSLVTRPDSKYPALIRVHAPCPQGRGGLHSLTRCTRMRRRLLLVSLSETKADARCCQHPLTEQHPVADKLEQDRAYSNFSSLLGSILREVNVSGLASPCRCSRRVLSDHPEVISRFYSELTSGITLLEVAGLDVRE